MQIQPQMLEILNDNLGNRLTVALIKGLSQDLQTILNEVCTKAYEEGLNASKASEPQSAPEPPSAPAVEKLQAEEVV